MWSFFDGTRPIRLTPDTLGTMLGYGPCNAVGGLKRGMVIGTVMGILGPTKVVGTALGMFVAASWGTVLMGTVVGGREIRGGLVLRTGTSTGDRTVSVLCSMKGSRLKGCSTGSGTMS